MDLASRTPSAAWEQLVVEEEPPCPVWAWFKPSHTPNDVVFQIPEASYRLGECQLTLRRLLNAAEIDPAEVQSWTVQGMTYQAQGGANPLLDQIVPPPDPAGIAVHFPTEQTPPPEVPVSQTVPAPQTADRATLSALEAIDAEWMAVLQVERQLDSVRRQVGSIQGTLQTLNRDLNPDEHRCSDSQDKRDWQDARRWLRDSLSIISKAMRSYDIGITSAAGNRRGFEQIYQEYIQPRRPFAGIESLQLAFEQHRKTAQSLLLQMQAAHATAARDGIQRAQGVLTRIAARVRANRAKR